jgi:AbrB family looped-hinge helix DNA binding protein
MPSTTVTSKGQITLPAEYRRALGIETGDKISVFLEGNSLRVRKRGNYADLTAGALREYAIFPPPSAKELREFAEQAMADDAFERMNRT